MSLVLSTGLRNYLLGGGSVRQAFDDALINIYSGVAPATVDEPPSGVLLNTISKASGAVAAGARSTRQIGLITIGSNVLGQTFIINITVDGVGPTSYTFTVTAAETTVALVALKVAQMLNDIPQLCAIASGVDGNIFVAGEFAGLSFTMAAGAGTGTISALTSSVVAASLVNSLKFAAPSLGVEGKNSDVWSGVCVADGTAGYFRLVTTRDDGLQTSTEYRIQGNVSTSGAELNLSNINFSNGATETIDSCQFTEPASD